MEQPNPTFAKIPILDTRKFEQWKFRIQQYLLNELYALWEVIEFSDSYEAFQEVVDTGSASEGSAKKKGRTVTVTTEDMQKRRNDTFGGNEATKKTKKNQLKHQYGNFKAEGKKTLKQTFNRLQAIVSYLEFMDVEIEQDDLNQKFLTSLALEWLMYMIVWRNRSDLDTMTKTSSGEEEVNTTSFSTASTQVSPASADVATASYDTTKEQTPKALMTIDRVGWDWSYMVNEEENHALFDHLAYDYGVWEEQGKTCPKNNNTHKRNKRKAVKASAYWIWRPKQNSTDKDNLGKFDAKGDEAHLESSTSNAQDACNADDPESSGNSNPIATSTNPLADHMETLTVESLIPTVSSPVPTACLDDSPEPSSDTRLISKRVTSQDDTPSLDNILTLSNRFEDILEVTTNTGDTNGVEADLEFPAKLYKVEKATYGLHQAPRAKFGYSDVRSANTPMDKENPWGKDRTDVRSANTPMDKENPWGKDRTGKDVDLHLYRSMIGSLMYLTASRPDIMFAVCAYARHQVSPNECHLHAVKRIFRYLKGHPKL
nr:hypothetical protein [Tanacetum cinerariifolium]